MWTCEPNLFQLEHTAGDTDKGRRDKQPKTDYPCSECVWQRVFDRLCVLWLLWRVVAFLPVRILTCVRKFLFLRHSRLPRCDRCHGLYPCQNKAPVKYGKWFCQQKRGQDKIQVTIPEHMRRVMFLKLSEQRWCMQRCYASFMFSNDTYITLTLN